MAAMRFAGMELGVPPCSCRYLQAGGHACLQFAVRQRGVWTTGGSPTRQACTSLTAAQHKTASIMPIALLADRRR